MGRWATGTGGPSHNTYIPPNDRTRRMSSETLELHIRTRDKSIKEYHKSLGAMDVSRSKHYEQILKIGIATYRRLNAGHDMFELGKSDLPSIDLYYRYGINGVSLGDAFANGGLSSAQVNYIYRGAQQLIGEIEKDEGLRECVTGRKY